MTERPRAVDKAAGRPRGAAQPRRDGRRGGSARRDRRFARDRRLRQRGRFGGDGVGHRGNRERGLATLLTSSSAELRRLSVKREQVQSTAIKLERSLSDTTKSLGKLELRNTKLDGENRSLKLALSERDESIRRLRRDTPS